MTELTGLNKTNRSKQMISRVAVSLRCKSKVPGGLSGLENYKSASNFQMYWESIKIVFELNSPRHAGIKDNLRCIGK